LTRRGAWAERRGMPRGARDALGGYCYHVLNRGNGRRAVFHKDGNFAAFVKLVYEDRERTDMRLLAYCLMGNHFHFLLLPRRVADLSRNMLGLTTAHVRRYHQQYHSGRVGAVGCLGRGRVLA
jgi:putative transposase